MFVVTDGERRYYQNFPVLYIRLFAVRMDASLFQTSDIADIGADLIQRYEIRVYKRKYIAA